jgi:hypothetical protein
VYQFQKTSSGTLIKLCEVLFKQMPFTLKHSEKKLPFTCEGYYNFFVPCSLEGLDATEGIEGFKFKAPQFLDNYTRLSASTSTIVSST